MERFGESFVLLVAPWILGKKKLIKEFLKPHALGSMHVGTSHGRVSKEAKAWV